MCLKIVPFALQKTHRPLFWQQRHLMLVGVGVDWMESPFSTRCSCLPFNVNSQSSCYIKRSYRTHRFPQCDTHHYALWRKLDFLFFLCTSKFLLLRYWYSFALHLFRLELHRSLRFVWTSHISSLRSPEQNRSVSQYQLLVWLSCLLSEWLWVSVLFKNIFIISHSLIFIYIYTFLSKFLESTY